MHERLIAFSRALVPADLRARVFDPTLEDLGVRRALRRQRHSGLLTRAAIDLVWATSVVAAAIECRTLGRRHSAPAIDGPAADSWLAVRARDARLAFRRLRREPGFAAFAVLTLAFGIGANVAVFSVVNSLMLAPLDVPGASHLVRVCAQSSNAPCDIVSYPTYADLRDGTPGLDLAVHIVTTVNVGSDDSSESRPLELVSGNYFHVLQLTPVLGRFLDARDDVTELAHPVVVLGEAFWRSREGARPDIVGRTVLLNDAPYEVVGIAPGGFHGVQGVNAADLWAPITMQQQLRPRGQTLQSRNWGWLRMIGRISPDASLVRVQAALDRTARDLDSRFHAKDDAVAYVARPATALEERDRSTLLPYASLTLALSALLLVVTCANLAGLMQARAIGRRRELAIRQSLGAGRGRLLAEWLTECATVAAIGGAAGLGLARLVVQAVARVAPPALIGTLQVTAPIDWRVAGFAAAVSLLAALLVALPTARRATAVGVADVLKDEVASTSGGRRGLRLRRATVLVQVATAALLLVGSGLLIASLRNLQAFNPGFRTDHLAGVSIDLKRVGLNGPAAAAATASLLTRVRALPGVVSADVVTNVPLTNNRDRSGFHIPGHTNVDGSSTISIDVNAVGAGYFATMGLTIVRGATWTPGDHAVVINETMAKRFWPGGQPVGESIELIGGGAWSIAGVVRDSAYFEVGETPVPFVYTPAETLAVNQYTLLARTSTRPEDMLAAMTGAVRATDTRVRPTGAGTFEGWRDAELYPQRLVVWATAAFGAIALGLTAVGLFGVVSTSVAMRTREIGIRMALGARPDRVLFGVLKESAVLVVIGAAAGLLAAYASAGLLRQWLFGVSRFDAAIYLIVAGVLGLMTFIAAGIPARRAARIDPVRALRVSR